MATIDAVSNRDQAALTAFVFMLLTRLLKLVRRRVYHEDNLTVTVADVRPYAMRLPRTTQAQISGRLKFRVGRIVHLVVTKRSAAAYESGLRMVDPRGFEPLTS